MARLEHRVSEELLEKLDAVRGFESRSSWVRRALEEKLVSRGPDQPHGLDSTVAELEVVSPRGTVLGEGAQLDRPASPRASEALTPIETSVPPHVVPVPMFQCRDRFCGFKALSPNAKCPRHPGKLVVA